MAELLSFTNGLNMLGDNQVIVNPDHAEMKNGAKIELLGKNNILYIEDGVCLSRSNIRFCGNNSVVYLSKSKHPYMANIDIYNNSSVYIGKDCYFNGPLSVIASEQQNVIIGTECLFSFGIFIRTADPHVIYDCVTKKRINPSASVYIGDHVWIGQNALILKGTKIGSGAITGGAACIANKVIPSNVSVVGNPAKVVRKNVFFLPQSVHCWTDDVIEKYVVQETNNYVYCIDENTMDMSEMDVTLKVSASSDERLEKIRELLVNQPSKNRFAVSDGGEERKRNVTVDACAANNKGGVNILEVHDVSIRYITGDFKDIGLKEYLVRRLQNNYHINEFWADRNISFTLEKGDMLGIIGTNGAGKSTLLKVISGIMEPTGGWVKREGNVAALLELASGFDGDLTVRENAYLRGAMLGYTRKFMDEKYDQIIEFAELQEFQDRPFKQLSSGMKSRLAFSIASLVEPDILILDEVLAVGDGAFRKKSESKMREIIAGGATTILVSHSLQQVREMCNKVLWLEKGRQIAFGEEVEKICSQYQQFLNGELKLVEISTGPVSCSPVKNLTLSPVGDNQTMERKKEKPEGTDKCMDMKSAKYGVDWAFKKGIQSVPKNVWISIASALIFGIVVHLQSFSGFILNWDSAVDSIAPAAKSLLQQGKWLWRGLSSVLPPLNIGSYNGILAILFISMAAGLVTMVLQVRSAILSALIGMAMVSFPSVMSTFSYCWEEYFFFSMFLAVAAAFFVSKGKQGYIVGILLLTLSLGIYPAYIGATAAILLSLCILDLLQNRKAEGEIVRQGLKYIGVLLAAIMLYYVVLLVALNITGTKLGSYRGIDSALASPSLKKVMDAFCGAYLKVIKFFIDDAYGRAFPRDVWCYRVVIASSLITVMVLIKKNQVYRKPRRLLLTFVLLLLMPVAIHAVGVLGQNANTHWIMIYPFIFIFIFALKLTEEVVGQEKQEKGGVDPANRNKTDYSGQIAQWTVVGVMLVILGNWFITTNAGYARLKISYEGAYTHCVMIVDELMALPEYDPQMPLAVIGTDQTLEPDLLNYMRFTGMNRGRDIFLDNHRYVNFIRDYLGIKLSPAPLGKNKELADSGKFKEMPCYPCTGFVQAIDGYLVVKLSDD